jgi:hypothetical protein
MKREAENQKQSQKPPARQRLEVQAREACFTNNYHDFAVLPLMIAETAVTTTIMIITVVIVMYPPSAALPCR